MLENTGFPYRIRNFRAAALALAAASALLLPCSAFARPVVDPSFDPGHGASERVFGVGFQVFGGSWDRKTVIGGPFTEVAGRPQGGLARFNEDGSLDTTFLGETSGTVWEIEVLNDNKILVAGSYATIDGVAIPGFARLNADGSLDTTFQARVNGTVLSVARQSDGKLVVGGIFSQANGQPAGNIARFLPNGALDTTFQAGYGADSWITSVEIDYSGRIVAGGNFTWFNGQQRSHLVRLLPSGAIDTTFQGSTDGMVKSLAIEVYSRVLVGGSFGRLAGRNQANVGRLNPDGSFDTSWNGETNGPVESIAVDTFGNLLIGGNFSQFRGEPHANLVRVGADGTVDPMAQLDTDGPVYRVTSPNWGDLVAGDFRRLGGTVRNRIGRLTDSYILAPGFDPATASFGPVNTILPGPYGGFLVGGNIDLQAGGGQPNVYGLARLSPDGQVDPYFRPSPNGPVGALLDLPDGSVLVGGEFTQIGGLARAYLARVLANGAVDPGFAQSPQPVIAFARQADGKVLVATRYRLSRIWPNGTADATFRTLAVSSAINGLAVQPDGRILVAVNNSTYIGVNLSYLYRLLPDGSLDSTFYADFDSEITAVSVLPDGKILAGGHFDRVNGQLSPKLARLEANGAFDPTWSTRIGTNYGSVYSLTPLTDGRLLATGWLYSIYPLCFACHFLPDGSVDPAGMEGFLAHEVPTSLVLADGSTVLGHASAGNYNGDVHKLLGRVLSPVPAEQRLSLEFGRLLWLRQGALPELSQVKFEISTDGGTQWQALAAPTRVAEGWQLDGVGPAAFGTKLRASGNLVTGRYNGSSSRITEVLSIADPNAPPEE